MLAARIVEAVFDELSGRSGLDIEAQVDPEVYDEILESLTFRVVDVLRDATSFMLREF